MQEWNVVGGIVGGVLIGISASLLLWWNGRILGVSGIVRHLLMPHQPGKVWRGLFVTGLVLGALLAYHVVGITLPSRPAPSTWLLVGAGLLVGIGTAVGRGCTSGHGVCGLALFSMRSLIAVLTFLTVGILTATMTAALTS